MNILIGCLILSLDNYLGLLTNFDWREMRIIKFIGNRLFFGVIKVKFLNIVYVIRIFGKRGCFCLFCYFNLLLYYYCLFWEIFCVSNMF